MAVGLGVQSVLCIGAMASATVCACKTPGEVLMRVRKRKGIVIGIKIALKYEHLKGLL